MTMASVEGPRSRRLRAPPAEDESFAELGLERLKKPLIPMLSQQLPSRRQLQRRWLPSGRHRGLRRFPEALHWWRDLDLHEH